MKYLYIFSYEIKASTKPLEPRLPYEYRSSPSHSSDICGNIKMDHEHDDAFCVLWSLIGAVRLTAEVCPLYATTAQHYIRLSRVCVCILVCNA